jgi:MYXO-CTERM domain-containing protein
LSCLVGRCVNSCQPGGGSGVDAGNGDGGGTPDQSSDTGPQASCSAASSLCTGDSCQRTCSKSSDCPTGYGCGKACFGCTETICLPPCRIDGDCPSQYVCQRGMCSLGCQNDQQCSQGETCQDKRCVRSCTSDADCPLPQSCENNICVDPDPLKKDRGTIGPGDLPKLKLAGGCGCQSTSSQPLTWGMLLLLLGVLVPVVRRKRQA